MIKTIFFDLDGTLNLMNQDTFTKEYVNTFIEYAAPFGYDPRTLIKAIRTSTGAMMSNDGSRPNSVAFWETMPKILGEGVIKHKEQFDAFYATAFDKLHLACPDNPRAPELIEKLKNAGYRLIIASNPVFPISAHKMRLKWTGVDPDDFDYISDYENSRYCKPSPKYYTEMTDKLDLDPAECLMVGNNVREDMAAAGVGMDTFLITYMVINEENEDISKFKRGDYDALLDYLGVK